MKCAVLAAFIGGLLVFGCASLPPPHPTLTHPVSMCAISCPDSGFGFRPQHLCRAGGKRWFEDIPHVIGEFIHRNEADGTVELAVWIACVEGWTPDGRCSRTADYPKADVITRPCSSAILDIVQSRTPDQRGVFPGEDETGRPKPPNP